VVFETLPNVFDSLSLPSLRFCALLDARQCVDCQ
jgi:hypothetical protein